MVCGDHGESRMTYVGNVDREAWKEWSSERYIEGHLTSPENNLPVCWKPSQSCDKATRDDNIRIDMRIFWVVTRRVVDRGWRYACHVTTIEVNQFR